MSSWLTGYIRAYLVFLVWGLGGETGRETCFYGLGRLGLGFIGLEGAIGLHEMR